MTLKVLFDQNPCCSIHFSSNFDTLEMSVRFCCRALKFHAKNKNPEPGSQKSKCFEDDDEAYAWLGMKRVRISEAIPNTSNQPRQLDKHCKT